MTHTQVHEVTKPQIRQNAHTGEPWTAYLSQLLLSSPIDCASSEVDVARTFTLKSTLHPNVSCGCPLLLLGVHCLLMLTRCCLSQVGPYAGTKVCDAKPLIRQQMIEVTESLFF
jgi:hypothetical protein